MDDFKLDARLGRLFADEHVQTPPFAYFQEIVANRRRKARLESLLFASLACLLFVFFYCAAGLGYGRIVLAFFGLVWFGLPFLLLASGREMWKNAAD